MPHLPHVNRFEPPTEEEQAARRAEAERIRADHAAARDAFAPARRDALLAGPALRDLEAAVECPCSCHPRPADPGRHDGGTNCSCQRTPEERRQGLEELLATFAALGDDDDTRAERAARHTSAAERLGVELRQMGGMAPFVISGVVDGRAFFLRERHDVWRVEIAPDEDPLDDPWTADVTVPSITVAHGTIEDLELDGRFDEVRALEVAVDAVRLFLLRRDCRHVSAGRFCPTCGVDVAEAAAWRISTDG